MTKSQFSPPQDEEILIGSGNDESIGEYEQMDDILKNLDSQEN